MSLYPANQRPLRVNIKTATICNLLPILQAQYELSFVQPFPSSVNPLFASRITMKRLNRTNIHPSHKTLNHQTRIIWSFKVRCSFISSSPHEPRSCHESFLSSHMSSFSSKIIDVEILVPAIKKKRNQL